jgi:predicted aconitase
LVGATKELANLVTALVGSDKKNAGEVGLIASRIGEVIPKMVTAARDTAGTTQDKASRDDLLNAVAAVGNTVGVTILAAKDLTEGSEKLKEFLDGYNNTNIAISKVLNAAKKVSETDKKLDSIDVRFVNSPKKKFLNFFL